MVFGFGYRDNFEKIKNGINAAIRNWEIAIKNINPENPDWRNAGKCVNRLKKEFERLARFAEAHFLLLSEFFVHINTDEVRLGAHGNTVDDANNIQGDLLNKLEFLWKHVEQMAKDIKPKTVEMKGSILVYQNDILPLFGEITKLVGKEKSDLHKLFDEFKNNPSREAKKLVNDVKAAEMELQKITM